MNVIRKVLAVVVMILAAVGLLMCIAGLVGTWVANAPVKNAVTGSLEAVNGYTMLAGQALGGVSENVSEAKAEAEQVQQQLANVNGADRAALVATVQQKLDQTIGPQMARASAVARAVGQSAVNVNRTLESVNAVRGVSVPTFTDQLQAVGTRIEDARNAVADVRSAVTGARFDGARAQAAAAKITGELDAIQEAITAAQTRLTAASATVKTVEASAPGWINLLSGGATLLFILFGAGQVFLFKAALSWFKRP